MVQPNLSSTDQAILRELQSDARQTNRALAAAVGVAPTTSLDRVRALEQRGVIRGYHAEVNLDALGRTLQAMVAIRVQPKSEAIIDRLVEHLWELPETLGVYLLSGTDDVMVHLSVRDTDALRRLILERISNEEGVVDERTSLVFEYRRKQVLNPLE